MRASPSFCTSFICFCRHFDGIVAWPQTRQTNGFIEAINGLFQAAKRKARCYTRFATMRTVLFLIAGKLDFSAFNSHAP
nr:transposase [Caballeronia sp. ATUFL_F2_KS42]